VTTCLEISADPNPTDHAGFPPLIVALSCGHPQPGSPGRYDTLDIIKLLLSYGADPNQRGINDYTPLHMAVGERHILAIEVLLEAGADPRLRTRIDDCETPRAMAERVKLVELAACWTFTNRGWGVESMKLAFAMFAISLAVGNYGDHSLFQPLASLEKAL
jgi:ankyrin repeat protein